MKPLATAFALLLTLSANALPLVWRADWPDCKPVEKLVHRGTDVELQPTWYIYGTPASTNGWTFTTYVQTNCVGTWFGPLPGAMFSHSNDNGAASYGVMVRAQAPDGSVNYTAFARLRMLDSPGFNPGDLPVPTYVIDFDHVTVLNPPWPTSESGDYEALANKPQIDGTTLSGNMSAEELGLATVAEAATIATNCTDAAIAELYGALQSGSFAPAMSAQSQQAILSEGLIDVASARTMQSAEIFSRLDAAAETNAQQSAELSTNYYTIAQTEVAITSHVPTNILFRNDMTGQSYDQPSTFGINPESDWMSIDFPGYTKFYYPNSNQVSKISKDAVADSDTSYPRFTSPTNLNQCVQYLTTAAGGVLSIELPADGATKDWIVYAYFGSATPLNLPAANWWMADEAYTNDIPANTPTAFYFSQVAAGIFTISRQELKTITVP